MDLKIDKQNQKIFEPSIKSITFEYMHSDKNMKWIPNRRYPCAAFCGSSLHPSRSPTSFLFSSSAAMSSIRFRDALDGLRSNPKEILLLDGGTGEELFRRGVPDDRTHWSATALVHSEYHSVLEDVHASFLESGSRVVTTNSYGVVPGVGFDNDTITLLIKESGRIARRAVDKHSAFVLGSMGPLIESYRPDKIMPHDEGVECYERACEALVPHVDAFLAETMSCVAESFQVLDAIAKSKANTAKPNLLISYSLDPTGNFRDGEGILEGLGRLLEQVEKQRNAVEVLGILFNCSEPEAITQALEKIHSDPELAESLKRNGSDGILLGAYANRLTQIDPNWTLAESETAQPLRDDLSEEIYWERFVKVWIDELDVRLVGGCCGITPEHISYIHTQLKERGQ